MVIASAGNRVKTSGSSIKHVDGKRSNTYQAAMAATCPTSCSTPRTSPAPCASAPACGLELARSSTASRKKTLPLMAASAVRKTTSGELASSPAGSSSRRAITASPSPAVFSDKNARNSSVTGLHSDPCFYVNERATYCHPKFKSSGCHSCSGFSWRVSLIQSLLEAIMDFSRHPDS